MGWKVSVQVSLRGMLWLIRVDTFRRVHNAGFLIERLLWLFFFLRKQCSNSSVCSYTIWVISRPMLTVMLQKISTKSLGKRFQSLQQYLTNHSSQIDAFWRICCTRLVNALFTVCSQTRLLQFVVCEKVSIMIKTDTGNGCLFIQSLLFQRKSQCPELPARPFSR